MKKYLPNKTVYWIYRQIIIELSYRYSDCMNILLALGQQFPSKLVPKKKRSVFVQSIANIYVNYILLYRYELR